MAIALSIKQGDTWRLVVGWYQPIAGTARPDLTAPVDITGYTARLEVRKSPGALSAPVLALSSPAGGLTVNGPAGSVTARAQPSQTTAIAPGAWYWEVELSNGVDVHTIAEGPLTVRGQVVL